MRFFLILTLLFGALIILPSTNIVSAADEFVYTSFMDLCPADLSAPRIKKPVGKKWLALIKKSEFPDSVLFFHPFFFNVDVEEIVPVPLESQVDVQHIGRSK